MERTDKLTAEEKWDLLTMLMGSIGLVIKVWLFMLILMWAVGW